jgi:simple sugar transport system ATP-binding protein
MSHDLALQVRRITKHFNGVLANDRIDFELRTGEIHAVLGENGAGKSTLMNIISGLYLPNEGEIIVEGQATHIRNPYDAIRCGIHMVHQDFMLIPVFTVAENIVLGNEVTRGLTLDMRKAHKQIRSLSQDYGLKVDPDAIVENLPVGLQQRVEILKALYRQARILILDEPTAVLTLQEVEDLFRVMRQLTKHGVSIIFITHKLKEVMTAADRITVMRRGRAIGTTTPAETDQKKLSEMMVGREVVMQIEKDSARPGEVVLDVNDLTVLDDRKIESVRSVSFQIRAGEIFGLAGVQGNGQTELAAALTGLRRIQNGKVRLTGQDVPPLNPRVLMELGLAHIPEDRLKYGLVLSHTIADNQILCTYYKPPFARYFQRNSNAVLENSNRLIQEFDIRTTGPLAGAETLSGGNQQKLIVSREMSRDIRLLIANQPTRGLDVGSIEYIHRQIVKMRDQGVAVLLISVELDEIMSLSDRIAVIFDGQIVAIRQVDRTTKDKLGLYMAGIIPADVLGA